MIVHADPPCRARYSTLLVIAKQPVAGQVKTRLAAAIGFDEAAAVAAASVADTFAAGARLAVAHRVAAYAGSATDWIPAGWAPQPQCGGGLDRRLAHAFAGVASRGPAFLIGMDTPQVSPDLLGLFDPDEFDACLGPAVDGGYWGIGLADPSRGPGLIHDVPMSTKSTFDEQLGRLRAARLRVQLLPMLRDVDTLVDARAVARSVPASRFAAELARVIGVAA